MKQKYHNMKIKNFANFALYENDLMVGYGHMEDVIQEAAEKAHKFSNQKFDICFVEFDGDIDDDNTKPIKGQIILSYIQFDGTILITSGK